MKFLLALGVLLPHRSQGASPIAKVVSMISELQAKVIKEGDAAQNEFAEFSEWCEDRSRNLGFEIKTGKSQVEDLTAAIAEEVAMSTSLTAKIEELGSSLATDEADLKAATAIRNTEAGNFAAEQADLSETVDMVRRASQIIGREMQGGASMLQLQHAGSNLAEALSVLVDSSMIRTSDAAKLTAFVQADQKQEDSDGDEELGAPASAVYKSHSANILDTLEELMNKAESQLDALRKAETSATQNFEMLRQSLEDEIAVATQDSNAAKKNLAGSAERRSEADGDLKVTSKELAADESTKASLHQTCMSRAEEFEVATKSRGDELKALAQAKQIIEEATSAAASFVQVDRSRLTSREGLANFEAVRIIRDLAREQRSSELAQLASRMATATRSGTGDPFVKIKGLIEDMISKLEGEASADATKKAYCDKELKETNTKSDEKTAEIEKLSNRIDQASAKSAKLKADVATLQGDLGKLAKSQAEMDKLRSEEKEAYTSSKAEQDKGLEGVKLALKLLKEYYANDAAHGAASGAAGGIISLLEVCESDMTKALSALVTQEETAAAEYERMTKANEIEKTAKDQDVAYKGMESKRLDKSTSENGADRSAVQSELDAVHEYLGKIEEQCIDKAEKYSERKRRREAEIAGLKEALGVLESETALLQRFRVHRRLRGGVLDGARSV